MIESDKPTLAKRRLLTVFVVLLTAAAGLVAFSLWQLVLALQGQASIFSLPATFVLLLGGVALLVEFVLGFRIGLQEIEAKLGHREAPQMVLQRPYAAR
jgi:hypothetical protein